MKLNSYSVVLDGIEVSAMQGCKCHYCDHQGIFSSIAYLRLDVKHNDAENQKSVLCENGHGFAVETHSLRTVASLKQLLKQKENENAKAA